MIKCNPLRSKAWLPVLFMAIIENEKAMADVEKVASGIPRMQEAMKAANLPEPEFHTEGMFTAVFKRAISIKPKTESVSSLSQACPKLEMRYNSIAEQIIEYCSKPHPIQEIMEVVGQTNRSRFKKNIINPLLDAGILSTTIPDKPNSPLQQYHTNYVS